MAESIKFVNYVGVNDYFLGRKYAVLEMGKHKMAYHLMISMDGTNNTRVIEDKDFSEILLEIYSKENFHFMDKKGFRKVFLSFSKNKHSLIEIDDLINKLNIAKKEIEKGILNE